MALDRPVKKDLAMSGEVTPPDCPAVGMTASG